MMQYSKSTVFLSFLKSDKKKLVPLRNT